MKPNSVYAYPDHPAEIRSRLRQIAPRLVNLRDRFRISQARASEIAGVSLRQYQAYEYGDTLPPLTVLLALAECYGVSLDYLVGRTDNPCMA